MKKRAKKSVIVFLAFYAASASAASTSFFYDSERQKYFSNERSNFTIKAVDKDEILDRIEISVDGSDFKPYGGTLNFVTEGPHQIRFRAVDPVYNWSPIQTFRIFVDKTPPKSQVVWKGPTFLKDNKTFINPKTTMNAIGQDNLSGVAKILWNTEKGDVPIEKELSFSKEGAYSYKYYAIDNVGNAEPIKDLQFTVDATPPKVEAIIQGTSFVGADRTYINTGATIELHAVDELSGVEKIEYQLNDGLVTTYSRPIILSENDTVLKYRAIDNVGNSSEWKKQTIFQDTKPPKVRVSEKGMSHTISGKIFARAGFEFDLSVTDEGSGVAEVLVSTDGGVKYLPFTDNKFTFTQAGEQKFHLKAKDKVGNWEETNPYVIIIDETPPRVTVKSSEPLVKNGDQFISSIPNRISFEGVDDGVGLDRIEVAFEDGKFEPRSAPIDLAQWKEKTHTIQYRAVDRLGNVSKPEKITITVKTTGPKVDLYVESQDLPEVPLSKLNKEPKAVEPKAIEIKAVAPKAAPTQKKKE